MFDGQFGVCHTCPPTTVEYTIEGSVGTCAMLSVTERTLAASQGASGEDNGLDSGTLIGIVISVVIAGIGGVVMFLKARKDKASQQEMMEAIHRSASSVGGIAGNTDPNNSNPTRAVENPLYFGNGEVSLEVNEV